jgi:hypothetical protein
MLDLVLALQDIVCIASIGHGYQQKKGPSDGRWSPDYSPPLGLTNFVTG